MRMTVPIRVLVVLGVIVGGLTVGDAQDTVERYVPREILLKPTAGGGQPAMAGMRANRIAPMGYIPELDVYRARLPPDVSVEEAIEQCRRDRTCEYAEPNFIGSGGVMADAPLVQPDDPLFATQWHLDNWGQTGGLHGADIAAPEAWRLTRGHRDVIVAVLDSGIDAEHPEFAGRILPGFDFVDEDDDPTADHPHGPMVTGLLAANADNGIGVAGVDHAVSVLPVKVLNRENRGTVSDLVQGLIYAAGADVINLSLVGYGRSETLEAALRYARDAGSTIVACAGNGGPGDADRSGPGVSPLVISVGATDAFDRRAAFSGTGTALALVAPGLSVATISPDTPEASRLFSGCSAATPLVSGAASLLRSVDRRLTHDDIRAIVTETADDLTADGEGWDASTGFGRLNLARALERVLPMEREIQISVRPAGDLNRINPASGNRLPVAILASSDVDIDEIVAESATFGLSGTEAAAVNITRRDVDADGDIDLVLRFIINQTGISCGDQVARLKVGSVSGQLWHGSDQIRTTGCRRAR